MFWFQNRNITTSYTKYNSDKLFIRKKFNKFPNFEFFEFFNYYYYFFVIS